MAGQRIEKLTQNTTLYAFISLVPYSLITYLLTMASTSSQATTNAQRVILRTSDDWRLWITQLEAYTADKTFWAIYIDPEVAMDAPPIEEPEPPAPYQFSTAYGNAQNAWGVPYTYL
jgi:hypothetical protein